MQFHLVLPGLGWAIGPSAALPALPALAALLGHARHSWLPASAPETWLAARFGLETSRLPYAPPAAARPRAWTLTSRTR